MTDLAIRRTEGRAPTLIFLPGYLSDMTGSKALALESWAQARGRAFIRFDYSGCGESPGDLETATLSRWRDDALSIIDSVEGPVVLIGSSMGGWIMLLAALARPVRIAGLIGIAAAPDFTDWGYTQDEKLELLSKGRIERPNSYGPEPTPITRAFWQSGEANRLFAGPIAIGCPVRLLHGQRDADVPWHHSPYLASLLHSDDVQVTLIKDGDHRISREQDVGLLLRIVEDLLERL